MGFPTLVHSTYPAICGCHGKLKISGYSCPRCKSRICDVPTECRVCGLTVVNAPQLARSYRHLFPVSFRTIFLSFAAQNECLQTLLILRRSLITKDCYSTSSALTRKSRGSSLTLSSFPQAYFVKPTNLFLLFPPLHFCPFKPDNNSTRGSIASWKISLYEMWSRVLSRLW